MDSPTRSNSRTPLALASGAVGVVAIPAAVAYSRYSASFSLLDAAYAIPVAAVAALAAIVAVRGTSGHVHFGPRPSVRAAWTLAVLAVCITVSASIAIGFYELLLRLER
jgi:hypothetical protein